MMGNIVRRRQDAIHSFIGEHDGWPGLTGTTYDRPGRLSD